MKATKFDQISHLLLKLLSKVKTIWAIFVPFSYFYSLHFHSTSHSAYVATETELDGAKIDGLLPPNIL